MHTERCFLIGAGGHAKVVFDAMQLMGIKDIDVWDDCLELSGSNFFGAIVKSPVQINKLAELGHVAIGDNQRRRKLSEKLNIAGKKKLIVIHPTATVAQYSSIQDGCFIAAHAVVAPDGALAEGVIVNHGAVVDHDCKVGSFSHIAPNATLGGGVLIGEDCLIGSGAVVLPGVQIASGVTVGAGAVVTADVQNEGSVVYGVPAQ